MAKSPASQGDKPKLLSGGNPQIPKGDGDAPVQAYIAAMPGWKHGIGKRLDKLIEKTVPGVLKAVRWNSPFYSAPDQEGWFLAYHCFDRYLKVTFAAGTKLDPQPEQSSKVKGVRYHHIHEGQMDEATLENWIRQASQLPGEKW